CLEPVRIGAWHSVKISRIKNRGMLQMDNGEVVRGQSKGTLLELNLGEPLYIGGVPEFLPLKYSLVVQVGLDGAIQRMIVNDEVWDDMLSFSTDQRNIEPYNGPPCTPGICKNNGRCIPILEDYRCQCVDGFSGKWCNQSTFKNR
ncbi:Agrin, partial [Araneus ventricosus]